MITLFENNDFILKLTGHDYDFVGIIENKNEERLTFFFDEEVAPLDENDEDSEWEVLEDRLNYLVFILIWLLMMKKLAKDGMNRKKLLNTWILSTDKLTGSLQERIEALAFWLVRKNEVNSLLSSNPTALRNFQKSLGRNSTFRFN